MTERDRPLTSDEMIEQARADLQSRPAVDPLPEAAEALPAPTPEIHVEITPPPRRPTRPAPVRRTMPFPDGETPQPRAAVTAAIALAMLLLGIGVFLAMAFSNAG